MSKAGKTKSNTNMINYQQELSSYQFEDCELNDTESY